MGGCSGLSHFVGCQPLTFAPPAEGAERTGAVAAAAEGPRRQRAGGGRRVRRPGVSSALGGGFRQGLMQAQAQPQAVREPGPGSHPGAGNQQAKLLTRGLATAGQETGMDQEGMSGGGGDKQFGARFRALGWVLG